MAYAIFDTPAIHGIPGIKELAQAGGEMVPPLVIAPNAPDVTFLDRRALCSVGRYDRSAESRKERKCASHMLR